MAVSVAATVLNEREEIEGLVASLAAQMPVPTEVIVVDGGSTDGTWEWLQAAVQRYPGLRAIRDESCNLKQSPGPIARGRNVAIRAAISDVVACADCGCVYGVDWLENLTRPIVDGRAEYSLGGSWIDPLDRENATLWDVAAAPFFGVKLSLEPATKSCTARSMAFRRSLWEQVGGFPETVFLGEDTMFDFLARKTTVPFFAARAKALYRPRHGLASALKQLASYAVTDGVLGVRPARLTRNLLRCVAEVAVLAALRWTVVPLLVDLALESYWAYRLDWAQIRRQRASVLAARLIFALAVPWVVTWNQIRGAVTKANALNRQNAG